MPDQYAVFNQRDVAVLKELVHWWRDFRHRNEEEHVDHQGSAPDVYIALVGSDGIPALTNATGTSGAGDVPGKGVCNLYQINQYGELVQFKSNQTVYNLNTTAIAQGWYTVVRDKWGSWLVQAASTTSSSTSVNQAFLDQTTEYVASGGFTTLHRGDGTSWVCQAAFGPVQHGAFAFAVWDSSPTFGGPQYLIVQIACPSGTATSHA